MKHRFKYQGRTYSLYKREQTREASWWLKATISGKCIRRSLETNNAASAELRAVAQFIGPAQRGNWAEVEVARPAASVLTIGALLALYTAASVGLTEPLTIRNNVNSFRLVVRRGMGDDMMTVEKLESLGTTVLTARLVGEFEAWMARQAVAQGRDLESNKRSVAGYLRQARSVFSKQMMQHYVERGTVLPDVSPFMLRTTARAAKVHRQPVGDELLAKTFAAARAWREVDRPAYIAWMLGLCSLRRGEIAEMRWDWLQQHHGRWSIHVPGALAKSGAGRTVPIDGRVAPELLEFQVARQLGVVPTEELFVLPSPRLGQGGPNCRLRAQSIFRRVNLWMRSQGWTTNHTLHEMRALGLGSVRDAHGLDIAQAVAGHSDQRTTQQHYVGQRSVGSVELVLPFALGPG